jgi:hypothetical protein
MENHESKFFDKNKKYGSNTISSKRIFKWPLSVSTLVYVKKSRTSVNGIDNFITIERKINANRKIYFLLLSMFFNIK